MRIAYLPFDHAEAAKRLSKKQLMNVWHQLLLQASGDVNQALEWMEYLFQKYGLDKMGMGFEEFREWLERERMIEQDGDAEIPRHRLTGKGERAIRQDSLDQIFSNLKSVGSGSHRTPREGTGGDNLSETRPFQAGDLSGDIDYKTSIQNAFKRGGIGEFSLSEGDLEVYEKEHYASCATVLMIDISHSMILYGEDRITPAKRTAIALAELIQTKYPKDSLEVITFGNEASRVKVRDLPYLQVGPFHTNTKAGLQLAQRLLSKKRQTNKQIFMITDGKPSVIYENGEIYRNSFGLDPLIVNRTLEEAAACKRKRIEISTFMIAHDKILVDFIDQLTRVNEGRAYYSGLDKLGGYIFHDYMKNRKRRVQ